MLWVILEITSGFGEINNDRLDTYLLIEYYVDFF